MLANVKIETGDLSRFRMLRGLFMAKFIFSAGGLILAYVFLSHIGSPAAAAWLTGGLGLLAVVWAGLAEV